MYCIIRAQLLSTYFTSLLESQRRTSTQNVRSKSTYHIRSGIRPLLFLASCDRSFLSPSPKWTLLQDCGCREKGLCSSIDRSGLSYSIFRTARASSSLVFRQLVAALKECSFHRACCSVFGFLIACMTAFFS